MTNVDTLHAQDSLESYMAVFSALSEPLRIRILQLIASDQEREYPRSQMDGILPVGESTISYHVAILQRAGLISVRKQGRNYFYRLRKETLTRFVPGFLESIQEASELAIAG
ncbi:metalloregulator ArsR/SmtB family transcription factor [Arthrobacter sp. NPDC080073]|uniref:ArsR/SmtB family transcription factor n=1 Tax=Arthrobacter sp. NPDC080073 TaxID=3155919 RepID=UPI003426833D